MRLYVTQTTKRLHPEARKGDFIFDPMCPCEVCVSGGPSIFAKGNRLDRRHLNELKLQMIREQGMLDSGQEVDRNA